MNETQNTTIVAISTPAGVGGIAVIRVSGSKAFEAVEQLFVSQSGSPICLRDRARQALYGEIQGLDQVVVTPFVGPYSFTGEDTVEISCHGSQYVQQELVRRLLQVGCVMAAPGEFTQRAFLHGRMDLSQAEAVADLIASTSEANNRLALNQLKGHFSSALAELRQQLVDLMALVELELDFSEEEVEFADRERLRSLADDIAARLKHLTDSFQLGNALKNGLPVAILGSTNVGKSTLLNALLGEERALVSDIHGTTRDTIEDTLNLGGILFRFIDTAGLRNTDDKVEAMGIQRALDKARQARIILWLSDNPKVFETNPAFGVDSDAEIVPVLTKIDSLKIQGHDDAESAGDVKFLPISARTGEGLDLLKTRLVELAQKETQGAQDIVVTNLRHYEALSAALASIGRVQEGLQTGLSGDFLAQDIRECTHHLGLITGQITTDEVLGSIFSRFCIGK